jgi:hypothetical protein
MDNSFLWVFWSIPFDVQVWLAVPSVLNKLVEMPAFGIYLEQSILDVERHGGYPGRQDHATLRFSASFGANPSSVFWLPAKGKAHLPRHL